MASPRPRVAPVTTHRRPERSNARAASNMSRAMSAGECKPWLLMVAGRARQRVGPKTVLSRRLAGDARDEHHVEMAEHLPHDEQRLLSHDGLRPQRSRHLEGTCRSSLEHGNDALAPP